MSQNVAEFEKLLNDFKKVYDPNKPKYEPSYLEICDYPGSRKEEICSRLLAFFFTTDKPHNMGNLFIDTLIDVYAGKRDSAGLQGHLRNVSAQTEIVTDNNNRIDLLLESEDLVISIENKIWAYLDNDLDDYYEYTNNKFLIPANKKGLFIILSVREDMENILNNRIQAENLHHGKDYVVIYYREFLTKLKQNLGDYITICNPRYSSILTDWILFLDREGGYMNAVSPEEQNFFREKDKELQELICKRNIFLNEKKTKDAGIIAQFCSELNVQCKDRWWVFDQTDLGTTFKKGDDNYEIGIESGFDINDKYNIQITIWNPNKTKRKQIVNHYREKLRTTFQKEGDYNNDQSKWEMKIKSLESNSPREAIIKTLNDVYEEMNKMVNDVIAGE